MATLFAGRVPKRFASERGASLSVALLLMLVCVALSAAILAASTASSGRFSGQGEMDRRYYAVTSAAELFCDSLGDDREITYVFTEQRTGQRVDTNGSSSNVTWSGNVVLAAPTGTVESDDAGSQTGYSFLPNVTRYALFGAQYSEGDSLGQATDGWIEPFTKAAFMSPAATHADISYSVGVAEGAGNALAGKQAAVDVDATARLRDDWTLEVDFHNSKTEAGEPADEAGQFHLRMDFEANVEQEDSRSEKIIASTTTDSGKVENTVAVTDSRRYTVTWRLRNIVSGGGLSDAA